MCPCLADVLLLAVALRDLTGTTRRSRTALWCALQMTLPRSVPAHAGLEPAEPDRYPAAAADTVLLERITAVF